MQEYADIQTQQREAKAKADVEKVFDVVEIRVQVWLEGETILALARDALFL